MINPDSLMPHEAVRRAVEAIQKGIPVILTDDESRENEGDLILAAEKLTLQTMALLIRECSGIVCLVLPESQLRQLQLPQMVEKNESRNQTQFTVSIEAREGVTTGVSAQDRITTIQAAIRPHADPHALVRPGHVFPLKAEENGVLARRGHTEGSLDLVRLAGLTPAAVLCELMMPDGQMMRGASLEAFAQEHDFPIVSIAEIVAYRLTH